jgi:hypothetical protein
MIIGLQPYAYVLALHGPFFRCFLIPNQID